MTNNSKYYSQTTYNTSTATKDSALDLFEPLFKPFIIIVIIVFALWIIIAHYIAIFRIRKETIKIRELLEDSLLISHDNEKED